MLRREGEVFLFGTAIAVSPLSAPSTESSRFGALPCANHVIGRAKQGAEVAGNRCRVQARSEGGFPAFSGVFQFLEHRKWAFGLGFEVVRRLEGDAWRPWIGIQRQNQLLQ